MRKEQVNPIFFKDGLSENFQNKLDKKELNQTLATYLS